LETGSVWYFSQAGDMKNKNKNGSRITIAQIRKALGMVARNYSDEEIIKILRLMLDIAKLSYDDLEGTN